MFGSEDRSARWHRWALGGLLLLAAWLRLVDLASIPACLEYDEAANVILAGEIARGISCPIFIRPYTGKEVLYFYLAAGVMKLAGVTPFALRLTSAALGLLGVVLTYWMAGELWAVAGSGERERRWFALFSAALVAVSYWQVNLSRFGYRVIVLPPLLALCIGFWLRGLRAERPEPAQPARGRPFAFWPIAGGGWFILSGAWAGLSAYTYSSVRVFPILLVLLWIWVLIADRRRWRLRLVQLLLFGLAALIVFAPLGLFFLRHPETFSVRLDQVSVFSPAVNEGDLWGTLMRTMRLAVGMFTRAGDLNPIYNFPGKPVFDRVVGPFFYLGLLICAWRLLTPRRFLPRADHARLPYFILLAWLLVMMIPNVLSASGVPHNLRAMALVPAVFLVAVLGLITAVQWVVYLASIVARRMLRGGTWLRSLPWPGVLLALLLLLLVGYEGARTYHDYVRVWAGSAAPYYKGNQALLRAAEWIDAYPQADPYVATYFHQHATLAVASQRYPQIRWLSGQTLVLPPAGAPPALVVYDHTNPVDPLLRDRYLNDGALLHREPGPDGKVAFEAYLLDGTDLPARVPRHPMDVNLGHTLRFLGYDLNASPRAGEMLDVTLYFRVTRAVDRDDFTFFAHLVDDLGFHWGGETFFNYPSAQWREGEEVLYRLRIPIAPGAPPGAYALDVGVFSPSLNARLPLLNEAGQMAGTALSVGPIAVQRAVAPPSEWPPIQRPQEAMWGTDLAFLGSDLDRSDLRPGETLALTLYWQALQPPQGDYRVLVRLSAPGQDVVLWQGHPVHGTYPFAGWRSGEFVRDRYALRLPIDTPSGDLDLRLSLLQEDGTPRSDEVYLGTIHVHATDRLWEPPVFAYPVGARLGTRVELLGYDLDRDRVVPGEALNLTLIWRCHESMDTAYTVFTHLLDVGQQVRGQKDNPPLGGSYPTTLWVPGEVVVDPYQIVVAPDAAPGQYVIEVGMYDPQTMQRLPVFDPTGAIGDRILLADVHVVGQE